jgi:hypothetical protein
MRPFPPLTELPPLTGEEITQIWLDPFGIKFLFSSKAQLYVESQIEHIEADGTKWCYDCQATAKAPIVLQRLLYQKITALSREDLCLTLTFEGGESLAIYSNLGQYEAGQLSALGKLIVF